MAREIRDLEFKEFIADLRSKAMSDFSGEILDKRWHGRLRLSRLVARREISPKFHTLGNRMLWIYRNSYSGLDSTRATLRLIGGIYSLPWEFGFF